MKRYWVFAGNRYARGGVNDLEGMFHSFDEALDLANSLDHFEWCHIYDAQAECIIHENEF